MIEVEDDGSPGCVLHVGGESFEVDDYLANSSFTLIRRWRRGEVQQLGTKGPYKDSGFVVEVVAGGVPLTVQASRTIDFLDRNRRELERLLTWPGIQYRTLDFGYEHRQQGIQIDRFSNDFMRLAGSLGLEIELSLYPRANPIELDPQPTAGILQRARFVGVWRCIDRLSELRFDIAFDNDVCSVKVWDEDDGDQGEVYHLAWDEGQSLLSFAIHWPSSGRFTKYRVIPAPGEGLLVTYQLTAQETWERLPED